MSGRAWPLLVALGLIAPGAAANPLPSQEAAALRRAPFEIAAAQAPAATIRILVPHEDADVTIDGAPAAGHGLIRDVTSRATASTVEVTVTWRPNTYTTITRSRSVSLQGPPPRVADLTVETADDRVAVRYVPTPHYVVEEMIALAGIRADDVVFEPGCGDARVTIAAVKAGARRGIGIDLDPERVAESTARVQAAGLERRIEIRQGDALRIPDLANATVVFLYMGDEFNNLIKPILLRHLRPGARIVSHRFMMGDWAPDKTVSIPDESGTTDVHLWIVPQPGASAPRIEPPPPIAPDVIARDQQGRATVRVTRIEQPLTLDGRLDEPVYGRVQSFGGFIQQEPNEGQPSTERSDVWVFFDDDNIYVSARLWKQNPADLIANEMRRDETGIFRNDSIGVVLDTFYDRRSGYYFNTNALGAVRDALLVNENQNANLDFNAVWDVASRRFDGGWSTEIAIPFKSLRYPDRREQIWGLLVQRIDWKKNEFSYLMPIPPSYGAAGIWKVSSAATLVGIEAPARGGRLELKPFALSSISNDRAVTPRVSNDLTARAGLDARYRLTRGLNVDFTTNTDFAQVEVDNQQLNLSRFSLFYPEKREFFLEMQNVMNFGPPIGPGGRRSVDDPTPILYFSRNVGLVDGTAVPIVAGGRVLGRAGDYTMGAFTMRTGTANASAAPATTFSVARVKRNILRRSSIGVLATHRAPSAGDQNTVLGAEGNFRFFQNVEANAYIARSDTESATKSGTSYLGQVRYAADKYGFEATQLNVSASFDAQLGFVPRRGFARTFAFGRFSPRPSGIRAIRKIGWEASVDYIADPNGTLETRDARGVFRINQTSGDEFNVSYAQTLDRPQNAFRAAGATIARGSYEFDEIRVSYSLGPQRRLVGNLSAATGSYYGGDKREFSYSGRLSLTSRFMIEPSVNLTWLSMPDGDYASRLVSARTTFTATPRMFVAALMQYNAATRMFATNARFRWEYRPGSDLFIVYSDNRDTREARFAGIAANSLAVKFTRLLQM